MADLAAQLDRGYCRTPDCAAPILWAPTSGGKRMPLDPTPTEAGNVSLDTDLFGGVIAVVHAQPAPGRLVPHWATCTAADAWRVPRG